MIHSKTYQIKISEEQSGTRMDKAMASTIDDLSRSRIKALIEAGDVTVNGIVEQDVSQKVTTGDVISCLVPEAETAEPEPENIPLDIIYEDDDLLVINKQVGLVVHPGAGNPNGTLVNALLYHCGDTLSGIGGVKRPGIVHRLDKDTSGLMVVAKNDSTHQGLSDQLSDRSLSRTYKAIVWRVPMPLKGVVDQPIGRHPTNRQKMAIGGAGKREARTHYHMLENFHDALSLLECKLESGRTHQIRVHMTHIRHPLVGDPVYGLQQTEARSILKKGGYEEETIEAVLGFGRQALHASDIAFIHPLKNEKVAFSAPWPDDMHELYNLLK